MLFEMNSEDIMWIETSYGNILFELTGTIISLLLVYF